MFVIASGASRMEKSFQNKKLEESLSGKGKAIFFFLILIREGDVIPKICYTF